MGRGQLLVLQGGVPLSLGRVLLERRGARQGHDRVQDRARTPSLGQEGLADSFGNTLQAPAQPSLFHKAGGSLKGCLYSILRTDLFSQTTLMLKT